MVKNILVVLGHPRSNSFCAALAGNYVKGAEAAGAQVKYIKLSELKFDAVGAYDYRGAPPLEPDLVMMQEHITWANHIVFVYPTWWSGMPALMKGFVDRALTPGFAYKYHPGGKSWDKLLKGRTGRIITTSGGPRWASVLVFFQPQIQMMKMGTFWFCGVWPVSVTWFSRVMMENMEEKRARYLAKCEKIGRRDAR